VEVIHIDEGGKEMSKLTAEQRVQRAHVWLMGNPEYVLYSGIMMMGNTTVDEDVPTACTNGKDTKYGKAFVEKLNDPELRGLILHENLHKAFRHLTVWGSLYHKNPMLANMACDYVINLMIKDSDPNGEKVRLPEGGLVDEKYRGMDAQTVFYLLKDEQDKNGGNGNGKGDGDTDGNGGGGFDEHDWEGAQELSKEEKDALASEIDQALRQGAILAGKMKGKIAREVAEQLEAKIDWRDALRDFVSSMCVEKDFSSYRRPNRRWINEDVYLPSMEGEALGDIVVGIDTSGSIGVNELGQFLGELVSICNAVNPTKVHLLYWDTQVAGHEQYERGSYEGLVNSTKPAGGGGTDPSCVPEYIKEHKLKVECVVMLTDGYVGAWGKWDDPVLWGITSKGITADVGTSIYVGD
jgi:predicted metal-dependent peptidase